MFIYVVRLAWHLKVLWFSEIDTSVLGKMGTCMNHQRYALAATWWGWAHALEVHDIFGDLSYFCFISKTTVLLWAAGEPDYWYGYSGFAYMEQSMAFP